MGKFLKILVIAVSLAVLCALFLLFFDFDGNKKTDQDGKKAEDFKNIEINGWKTYRNEEYGFEVKYPDNWEYTKIDGVTFGRKNCEKDQWKNCRKRVNFSVYKGIGKSEKDVYSWKNCEENANDMLPKISAEVNVCHNSLVNGIDMFDAYHFIDKNDNGYEITVSFIKNQDKNIEKEILKSLELINKKN